MSYDSQTSTTLINKLRKDVDSLTLKVAVLTDSKTSGTSGGTGVATTWSTRTLNTIQSDPNGLIIDLTGNTFKLAAGSYQVRNSSAFLHTGHTRMRVYDVTNAVVIGYSVSVEVSNQANLYLDMNVRIIPHKDTIYRIDYYITASGADHLGVAASLPTIDEIYSVCEITRLDTGMTKPLGTGGLQGPQGPAGPTGPSGPPGPSGGGVTSVNVSGGATGLSTSGGPITTSGTITLGGIVAVTAGGTGAITAPAALTSLGAYPASNPSGYNVGTVTNVTVTAANGVTASVATSTTTPAISLGLGAITPTSVASTGTVTGTNVSGSTSGTNTGDQAIVLSGDVSGSGSTAITTTIGSNAVTYAKMQAISASSKLLGSSASGTAVQEITLGSNLSMAGSTLNAAVASGSVTSVNADGGTTGFSFTGGPITSSGTLSMTGTLAVASGGTGAATAPNARTNLGLDIGTDIPSPTGTGATGTWNIDVLGSAGTITSTLPIAKGGTGATTDIVALTNLGAYPANNPAGYTANAGTVTNVSVSGSANISVLTGSTTPVISQVGASTTQNGFMSSTQATKLDGITAGASVTSVAVSGGTTGLTTSGGPITTFGTITMAGTLAVTNGGTGAITAPLALVSLGAYPANNPNGYNVGTVTGVGVSGAGLGVTNPNTTPVISQSAASSVNDGFMSIAYASKLDGIAVGASVTSVAASGGTTGLSFTGGPITGSGTLIMNGTLNPDSGGTGHTAPTVNGLLLIGDAVDEEWDKATLTAGTGITITNGQGSITIAATGSGSGDVTGPSVSVDGDVAVFNGTTGKIIKVGATTGTGNLVRATSPTLVTPVLGTPSSGTLTNCTFPVAIQSTGITCSSARVLGRSTAGTGSVEQLTLGAGLSLTAGVLNTTGSGSGDVVGPISSNTNALAKFSSTTGKLIGEAGWSEDIGDLYGAAGFRSMVAGFVWIPSGVEDPITHIGAPAFTPFQSGTLAGRAPLYFDRTNSKLYIFNADTPAWVLIN